MKLSQPSNPRGSELLLVVAGILIVNLVLTNTLVYLRMRTMMKQSIIENELPLRSALIYSEIKRDLQPSIIASESLAKDLFIMDWLNRDEPDKAFIGRYLESIRNLYGGMTCFLVSEKSRTYYNMNGGFPILDDDEDARWYFDFLNSTDVFSINISVNVDMGNVPTAFINYRIMDDNGSTLGVAGLGLALDTIPAILTEYGQYFDRDIYFIDSGGTIIAKSADAGIEADSLREVSALGMHLDDILDGDNIIVEYKTADEVQILHSMYLPELDWLLVSVQRESDALQKMNRLILSIIAIHVAAILLTLLLISLSVRFFQKRLREMATKDALTGISNRQVFEYALRQAISLSKRKDSLLTVLLIDVDHFKKINDTHGHLEGDRVLIEVARCIQEHIRGSDDFCRWGGEEFVLLAYECNLFQGLELADKIRRAVETESIALYQDGEPLTVSIGVSEIRDLDTPESFIQRADAGLYLAKSEGRNCVRFT